ncbi:MAG: glycoside hydrolase family 92 protein [Clostridia bacterium]|nr:glycoside hydrolase family 92 protein [Clostridia bacterium]
MKDFCKYVNVFHGCGEIDLPKPEGIAATWFFIKAGCGNTSPAASLPFSAVSVGPFSGGYPTGYTDHMPNSHSRPPRFEGGKGLKGFAHLQQSGTGAIGYYYNYAVVSPRYSSSPERRVPALEEGEPGYYRAVLEDINCELTVSGRTALHRYTFGSPGGFVTVDFENNGVDIPNWGKEKVYELELKKENENTVSANAVIEGVKIFFAVRANGKIELDGNKARVFVPENGVSEIRVSLSPVNAALPLERVSAEYDFCAAKSEARKAWNGVFSKIDAEFFDERTKGIFYSNLYHSLVKPADWSGESFIYGEEPFTVDLNTLWDMYKTELPLLFAVYGKEIGEKLCETLMLLCEKLGFMPNSIGLSDEYKKPNGQARMLGSYALITALRYGLKVDPARILSNLKTDLTAPDKIDFTRDGRCVSHTFLLDMAEICTLGADLAKELGDTESENYLRPFGRLWKKVYSEKTGLLNDDTGYYEGTLYNYSFRQMVDMDGRIALAGGKERFVELLDRFFGYGAPAVTLPTDPDDYEPVIEGAKLGRFEGFNNESDTEAPFSYAYAGRHDRVCEVTRAGMKYMFTDGRGGIPGNNDTGALSSYYVFMALGLFPVAGQDLFIIGSPFVKNAEVTLFNGNTLKISVDNNNIYVKSVKLNGKELADKKITARELMRGGELVFEMSEKPV